MATKTVDLTELQRSVSKAHKASSAMRTFATLFHLAATAAEGDDDKREQFPNLHEISSLCESLAVDAEDAFFSIRYSLDNCEKSIR